MVPSLFAAEFELRSFKAEDHRDKPDGDWAVQSELEQIEQPPAIREAPAAQPPSGLPRWFSASWLLSTLIIDLSP